MSEQLKLSHDWVSHNFPLWEKVILPHKSRIRNILEIGCYEGRASVWFLKNINASLVAIDSFQGDEDLRQNKVDFSETKERWEHNTEGCKGRCELFVDLSLSAISHLICGEKKFDLIFVDGDHSAQGCLSDLVMSWQVLNPGGFMIIDDRLWGNGRPKLETPKPAIDAFLNIYAPEIEVLHLDYQAIIRRK